MKDKKLTDKDHIKALEILLEKLSNNKSMIIGEEGIKNLSFCLTNILDLINRLQEDKSVLIEHLKKSRRLLKTTNEKTTTTILHLQTVIAEQKSENESLKAENDRLQERNVILKGLVDTQNAENERLKRELNLVCENSISAKLPHCVLCGNNVAVLTQDLKGYDEFIADISAEAYKECIEKVKDEIAQALENNYKVRAERIEKLNVGETDEFISYCGGKIDCLRGLDDFLDNLLKELVGDKNDNFE